MADNPLAERRSALAEGAARFDALARDLKFRQLSETRGTPEIRPPVPSPDEVWARNYMTLGIGPKPEIAPVSAAFAAPPPMPKVSMDFESRKAPFVRSSAMPDAPVPIGRQLGKPAPRRSWLGRLLRGNG